MYILTSLKNTFYLFLFLAYFCSPLSAQAVSDKLQSFSKNGFSFNYEVGWSVTEQTTEEAYQVDLALSRGFAKIKVVVSRDLVGLPERIDAARRKFTEPLLEDSTRMLSGGGMLVKRDKAQVRVGDNLVEGVRLRGSMEKKAATVEIYSFAQRLRFVNLVFISADKDHSAAARTWQALLQSLSLEIPLVGLAPGADRSAFENQAISLPKPAYPPLARAAKASGTVEVQVIVDENGNVTDAHAISGHPFLLQAAEQAARLAKFKPVQIYGQPVRVTGVINYNFVR